MRMEKTRPILYGVADYAELRKANAWFIDRTAKNVVTGNQCDIDLVRRLERNYVPCVKNGRAGLYDAVSKTVCYSQGSSDFVAPPRPMG